MRVSSTFLKTGDNPTAIKLSDIEQTVGFPGELVLCTYDDNVTRQARYMYFSAEAIADEVSYDSSLAELNLQPGWYLSDASKIPDFRKGTQNIDLVFGQGCVIESSSNTAEYTVKGVVDSIQREFQIPANARKMMGNVLPRAINLSEIKQTVGFPGELVLCTYDNNVTRQARYMYFSEAAIADEVDWDSSLTSLNLQPGWYLSDASKIPDFKKGAQDIEFASGQGFVVESSSNTAVLQFPSAM